jgi:hypothetical protein
MKHEKHAPGTVPANYENAPEVPEAMVEALVHSASSALQQSASEYAKKHAEANEELKREISLERTRAAMAKVREDAAKKKKEEEKAAAAQEKRNRSVAYKHQQARLKIASVVGSILEVSALIDDSDCANLSEISQLRFAVDSLHKKLNI